MKNRLKIHQLQMEYKPQRNQKMRLIEGLALLLHEETMIIGQLKEVIPK